MIKKMEKSKDDEPVKFEDREFEDLTRRFKERIEKATSENPAATKTSATQKACPATAKNDIARGRFGWGTINASLPPLPYIFRGDMKLVASRIFSEKITRKFTHFLSPEILDCMPNTFIVPMPHEVDLLNEINMKHSDCYFGKEIFTTADAFETFEDCLKRYEFLDYCLSSLLGSTRTTEFCGFVDIDDQNLVPFVCHGYQRHVPLFYFEGESGYLETIAFEMTGWELSFLRFLCKVQQIKNSLYEGESVAMVALDKIVKLFPPNTTFRDAWPSNVNSSLLKIKKLPAGLKPPVGGVLPATQPIMVIQDNETSPLSNGPQKIPNGAAPTLCLLANKEKPTTNENRTLVLAHPAKSMARLVIPQAPEAAPQGQKHRPYFCYVPLPPFQASVTYVAGKRLVCVNAKAHDKSANLVSVEDIRQRVFPARTLDEVMTVVEKLGMQVVRANEGQERALKEMAQRKLNKFENISCINLRQFVSLLPEMQKRLCSPSAPFY